MTARGEEDTRRPHPQQTNGPDEREHQRADNRRGRAGGRTRRAAARAVKTSGADERASGQTTAREDEQPSYRSVGLHIPEDVYAHPVLRQLRKNACDIMVWSLDIAGIARQQATSDRHNLVLVLMAERRLTLQSAVTAAGALVKKTVGVFLENERLLSDSAQLRAFGPCVWPTAAGGRAGDKCGRQEGSDEQADEWMSTRNDEPTRGEGKAARRDEATRRAVGPAEQTSTTDESAK
ncbi:hypothetical protein FOMPIDRAFT_1051539 [Fomitopsis schrenkii]|uniref:Uncharacterized protein n=1 Tax=Fomitopsis schrenkii TaxID=2126942 RepID=S8E527_FOMSC|nr:hypothetical protein FOMPIDRAFT_1051539 [Fomitopsis schrenkii]